MKRWRRDEDVKGRPYRTVCICLPADELERLDAMAERCQMSRSHFLRQAAKHLIAKVRP